MAALRHPRVPTDGELVAALRPARRVATRLLGDGATADDVVQQTALRLLESRSRLDSRGLRRYAEVTARNLAVAVARRGEREVAVDPGELAAADTVEPHERVELTLEHDAVRAALGDLDPADRRLLLEHAVADRRPAELAAERQATARAVSLQLLRGRARLRVATLLRHRRLELPSTCVAVLPALSERDRRRERALGAATHVAACRSCLALAPAVVSRDRRLLGILPLPAVVWRALDGSPPRPLVRAVAGGAAASAAAAVVAAAVVQPAAPPPAPGPRAVPSSPVSDVLATVLFASGSARLDAAGVAEVTRAAAAARDRGARRVVVAGYTDARSDPRANRELARQRADAVATALTPRLAAGVAVSTAAYGEQQPVASNDTAAGRAQNRRVVIRAVR